MTSPESTLPLPSRLTICPWGVSYASNGKRIVVNEQTLATFAEMQQALSAEEIALDFEHNSYLADKDPRKKADPIPVAAYGAPACFSDEGLVLDMEQDKWTPDGAYYYANKHYRDLSPVLKFAEDGETVLGVTSVALTRKGAIPGLHAFSEALNSSNNNDMPDDANNALQAQYDTLKKGLIDHLSTLGVKVQQDSTAEQILQALSQCKTEEKDKTPEGGNGDQAPFSAEIQALNSRLGTIQAWVDNSQKDNLINTAVHQGKKLPLSKDKLMAFSAENLETLLNGLQPGEVPFSASSVTPPAADQGKALTPDQKALCARLGVTEEAFSANLNK